MNEVTHVFCMTFGFNHTVLVEVDCPADFRQAAISVAACKKARQNIPAIEGMNLTNCQYLGKVSEVVFVKQGEE